MTIQTKTHGLLDSGQSQGVAAQASGVTRPASGRDVDVIRVCLVGAGVIAQSHAEALRGIKNAVCAALVEPSSARAGAFAARWNIPVVYKDLASALEFGDFDAVHILTPPDSHAQLAQMCLENGRHVLVEKPVAVHGEEVTALIAAQGRAKGVSAAVNQNFIYHPAFTRLREAIASKAFGPLRTVHVAYNVPLRQLAGRQFGAWMFEQPKNILLEQAVHPLSQIVSLIGPIQDVEAMGEPGMTISPGIAFHATIDTIVRSATHTAHLQFAVGRSFPFWQVTAVCDDGVLFADILNNRYTVLRRGPLLEPVDMLLQGLRGAASTAGGAMTNALHYVLALARLRGRSDPFFLSMKGSIEAFYAAIRSAQAGSEAQPLASLALAGNLVATCEAMARKAFTPVFHEPPVRTPEVSANAGTVAVLGGTGFIGAAVVRRLVAAGHGVRVMARNTKNLADIFYHPHVQVLRGDIRDKTAVAEAVAGASAVINLAHGGGGSTWDEIRAAMVGGAEAIADCCLSAGVSRLVHVGSIAGLYAGDPKLTITCDTPPDAQAQERADYARAKAETDRMLLKLHKERGLPVCILRPGIVLGHGTSPFHSGFGVFNNEQHCVGWNGGHNPLPLVLVDDVADAVVKAVNADGVAGRAYNLVGDVRFNARAYVSALARTLNRPLRFHPSPVWRLYMEDWGKWLIKRIVGRPAARPSLRDLRSRGLVTQFDCSLAKRDLAWTPEKDPAAFIRRAFAPQD